MATGLRKLPNSNGICGQKNRQQAPKFKIRWAEHQPNYEVRECAVDIERGGIFFTKGALVPALKEAGAIANLAELPLLKANIVRS